MTGTEGAKLTAILAATATIPAMALRVDEVVLLVAMPLLATWIGLAGIGVLEGQSTGRILRKFVGSVMLGGIAGIVALALIDMTGVRGYLAMFLTLAVGMGALSIARKLSSMGGRLLDPLWSALGLERKGGPHSPELDELVRKLDDKDKKNDG